MSTSFKIRLLLFLLAFSFGITALTVHYSYHKADVLAVEGSRLARNLHKKELYIKQFLSDSLTFEKLEAADKNAEFATELISDPGNKYSIYLYTYRNNKLVFWGTNSLILETDAVLREGSSLIRGENGWYEAVKRSKGDFSAVCFIPVKSQYPYENEYLKNIFDPRLVSTDRLEIAHLNDSHVYNIRNIDGKYLFSVKLKPGIANEVHSEPLLWVLIVLCVLFACIFMNTVCVWIASKRSGGLAIAVLLAFILLMRIPDIHANWFYNHLGIPLFEPWFGSKSFFFPSIGGLLLNVIAVLWFLAFTYSLRFKLKAGGRIAGYLIAAVLGTLIYLCAEEVNSIFYDLVTQSNINFDLTNILNLDWRSWTGIVILCFCLLNLYLLAEIILNASATLNFTNYERLILFLAGAVILFIIKLLSKDLSLSLFLFTFIIFLRGWAIYKINEAFNLSLLVLVVFVFAVIASLKLSDFQIEKELEQRKSLARQLESADDPYAVLLFSDMEKKIVKDDFIINSFINPNSDKIFLNNYLQKAYFNGYLGRYNFTVFQYIPGDTGSGPAGQVIGNYRSMVLSGSTKVSRYFYKNNNTFGFSNYFSLLPIRMADRLIGTLIIELKSKSLLDSYSLPPVLINNKVKPNNELLDYSFAYYNDNHLVSQYGSYIYDLENNNFKGVPGSFVFADRNNYTHVIYQVNPKRLIVISKPVADWIAPLASVSFLFLVLLFFAILIIGLHWFCSMVYSSDFRIRDLSWNYILSRNHILYRTRIQVSMVAATVITLIIVGTTTYLNISYQYRERQKDMILEHIAQINTGIESQMFQNGILYYNEQLLNAFTSINATELNLYGPEGKLLFTTQPQIYNNGVLADRMDARAYIYLSKYQRSEYINIEKIGKMRYYSAYKPIQNNRNETVAYLNLPDFTNEKDFQGRIGHFLNTLINIYTLVFMGIGLFAIFLANKITYPLTIVQKNLSQIKIGHKNEPIVWKGDDEIGNLIKEYNKMIVALEESAQRFARSERETAWKEMAKQVAHEIKNPLTPLKLGVQLLEKSWKEKDPNFDKKFEKFSKSFVEQIESLSHIASEFSNFAKMPDTLLETVNLREIIEQSVEVFKITDHVTLTFADNTTSAPLVKGDKDQLLRSFNNLIKNSVEAIPEQLQGKIDIIMEDAADNKQVLVRIADNGKGIPEGLRERIFNPNFTTKSSGTGLGLAFVKQAIENMMGTIRFETELNKGTVFYITLPLVSE